MRILLILPKKLVTFILRYRGVQTSRVKRKANLVPSVRAFVTTLCVLATLLMCSTFAQTIDNKEGSGESNAVTLRTGIWVIQPVPKDDAELQKFEKGVRENPYLSGVILHAGWNEVEKNPGKYNFDGFDRAIAVLLKVGMKYKLGVKPGTSTPQFVYQEGAATFQTIVTNPHRATHGDTVTFPLPWDPIYQTHFSRLIKTFGERYSSDPLCVSVAVTCANYLSAEMHLPKRPEDMQKWRLFGDYKNKLLDVYKKYTDEWARAFPRQEICLHVSPVLHMPSSELIEKVIENGISKYPNRFAIQNCVLSGRREDTGKEPYDIIVKYKDRAHHGFQSLAGFSHSGERMGSIEMAALNLVHAGGEYWELWHGDGMSIEISQKVAKAWDEAKKMGYDAYKTKLIAEGLYRKVEDDTYWQKVRKKRNRK